MGLSISYHNISKTSLWTLFATIFASINILAYEQHIFNHLSKIVMITSVFFLIFFHLLFFIINKKAISLTKSFLFLLFSCYLLYLYSINFLHILEFTYISYAQTIKIILIAVLMFYLFLFFQQNELIDVMKAFFYIGLMLALINIIIILNNGFFIWSKVFVIRGASIFYDPNFFAAFNLFLILFYYFFLSKKRIFDFIILILLLISLVLTFSKAAILSLTIVFFFFYFTKQKTLATKTLYIMIAMIFLAMIFFLIKEIPGFRFEMGGNNRDDMALFFLNKIWESPYIGYGEKGIELQLVENGLINHSFHSFILDKTFAYGTMAFFLILSIFTLTFFKLFFTERRFAWIWLGLVINSFFIDYSIGGYGTLSILLSLIFIYASKIPYINFKHMPIKKDSSLV